MLSVTQNMVLPTAITGSYPRPLWFDVSLSGRSFKSALGESLFREQYLDAVSAIINAQEAAGLDIVTDGDSRFDLPWAASPGSSIRSSVWAASRATATPPAADGPAGEVRRDLCPRARQHVVE